jgi:hypothetical protein
LVERAITERLCEVMRVDFFGIFKVCDRPRNAKNAVMRTGGQAELLKGGAQYILRPFGHRAEVREPGRRDGGVA